MKSLVVILAAVLLSACGSSDSELPTYNTVAPFQLTAQNGEEFLSDAHLKGKVWLADFIFTTCTGPCPRMSARMKRLQQEFAELPDVRLVSFTVDPETDTPEVLAEYGQRFGAEEGRWYLLTGDSATLHRVNRKDFMLGDVVKGETDHSTRFALVDRTGMVRGYYMSGDSDAMDRLSADVRALAAMP